MDNSVFISVIILAGAVYFGLVTMRIAPILARLIAALFSGRVKWPGPPVHNPDPRVDLGRQQLGLKSEHLFPTFLVDISGPVGAFLYLLLSFLARTPLLSGYIAINWSYWMAFAFIAFVGGMIGKNRAARSLVQVGVLLDDLASQAEPRQVDTRSAEGEYAIEHPLLRQPGMNAASQRALELLCESTWFLQAGNDMSALNLYQQALQADPALHEHAREALRSLPQGRGSQYDGPIYYWLGLHSEYLHDLREASTSYERATAAFAQTGYTHRESRVHCNLGHIKMLMHDPTGMDEFERAIALNPKNGTAHLNIARTYYSFCGPGDFRYERALDAFADAIIADPLTYGPKVIASLRELGYTWKEDLENITQRVERKRGQAANGS